MAGGITGCPDWQHTLGKLLENSSLVLLNPRRASFQPGPNAAQEQIVWEYTHLRKATAISFWFPEEAPCPIALYELGAWSMTKKPLFVGVHPGYQRHLDVQVQTALARPDVQVVESLEDLASQIGAWVP